MHKLSGKWKIYFRIIDKIFAIAGLELANLIYAIYIAEVSLIQKMNRKNEICILALINEILFLTTVPVWYNDVLEEYLNTM